ncbi:YfjI family protein [Pirellulaceae bacterium]|nr:YfjI family protein [Pirellulaceae bacterium]
MSHQIDFTKDIETKTVEQFNDNKPIPLGHFDLDGLKPEWFGGDWLSDMVDEASKSIETPVELAGILGLGCVSAAIAKKFSVRVEPGYFEPCNLWGICAMEPSSRKSAVLGKMVKPIDQWESNQRETWQPVIEEAKSERQTLEDAIKERRKNASKLKTESEVNEAVEAIAKLESELPRIPSIPQLRFDDCTPEKIAVLMKDQNEVLGYIESESDALFSMMMGKYSDSPALDVYLKSYSGSESLRVERQTRESIHLQRPHLTLCICPQPTVIQRLSAKPILVERGLLARFVYFVPKSLVGFRDLKPREIPKNVEHAYSVRLRSLLDIEFEENPKVIKLSKKAYSVWKEWQRSLEKQLKPDGTLGQGAIKYWGGKLAGNTIRIAAAIHSGLCRKSKLPDEFEIDKKTMENAVNIARASISHAMAVHDMATADENREMARQLLDYCKRNELHEISQRELFSKLRGRSLFNRSEDVGKGLDVLVEFGWVYQVPADSGNAGRPSKTYLIHSDLF